VARAFAAEGAQVSIIARTNPRDDVRCWEADIENPAALKSALDAIVGERGVPSKMVWIPRHRGPGDPWEGELRVGLGLRHLLDHLVGAHDLRNCSVVAVASVNATLVSPRVPTAYHAAKAALSQLVRCYAVHLGPRNVRVNSVSPGTFLKPESGSAILADPALEKVRSRAIPLRRHGTAEEVAQVILFLCGPKSSFVTGQDIVVDGGVSLIYQEALGAELERPQ
jgi:NAD(P)-dependent dehydrogenase (short-subunit alcohol dehydrogenase family)